MTTKTLVVLAGLGAMLLALAGCEPQRTGPMPWTNPLDAMEASLPQDAKDRNYNLARMEFARVAILLGCPMRAKPRLMEAFDQFEVQHENTGAAISSERYKFYKGETFERAMLCAYLAMIEYQTGQYNNARIFFTRAISSDQAAIVKKDTPAEVGDDFGLAYFWLGRAFTKLGEADNAAIAFRKVATVTPRKENDKKREQNDDRRVAEDCQKKEVEGEKWIFERFSDPKNKDLLIENIVNLAEARGTLATAPAKLPDAAASSPVLRTTDQRDEFLTPAYQADANFILTVEVGRCPWKMLTGINQERTEFMRFPVRPASVRVYIDGHAAGPAFQVLDLWEQAATQDRIAEKDAAQTGKGIAKFLLSQAPIAGSMASHWDVSGDVRHWTTLPGRVFVFAGKVAPGPHTVRIEMYDCGGNLMPRWTNTYYGLGVPATGEADVLLEPRYDADNRLPPADVEKALKNGAKPGDLYF